MNLHHVWNNLIIINVEEDHKIQNSFNKNLNSVTRNKNCLKIYKILLRSIFHFGPLHNHTFGLVWLGLVNGISIFVGYLVLNIYMCLLDNTGIYICVCVWNVFVHEFILSIYIYIYIWNAFEIVHEFILSFLPFIQQYANTNIGPW